MFLITILNDVYKVNCIDESRLKCRNFIFIVNNFKMYNFLKDIEFKNNQNNLIIALHKNDKELIDRYLLFGEDFTK